MLDQTLLSSVRESLAPAQTISILLPQNPNLDRVAASLALFLSLKKTGKQTTIVCPTEMTVEFSALVGVDKIQKKLAGRNLTVSFDYLEDSIEKVSYNIENDKFNLVIQPKVGFPPLSTEKVKYSYSGGETDLVFTVDIQKIKDLGGLSQGAKVNLIDPSASSCSEIVAHLISRLGLPIDEDIATNLLLGIEKTTKTFSSLKVGAGAFEAAAFCLRAGARRATRRWRPERKQKKKAPLKPMPTEVSAAKKPEERKPPSDWLEPKIYKGNTRI